jgi:hypothetical protein
MSFHVATNATPQGPPGAIEVAIGDARSDESEPKVSKIIPLSVFGMGFSTNGAKIVLGSKQERDVLSFWILSSPYSSCPGPSVCLSRWRDN